MLFHSLNRISGVYRLWPSKLVFINCLTLLVESTPPPITSPSPFATNIQPIRTPTSIGIIDHLVHASLTILRSEYVTRESLLCRLDRQ